MRVELTSVHDGSNSRLWESSDPAAGSQDAGVFEDRWYSVSIYDFDRNKQYALCVGDERLKLAVRSFPDSLQFEQGVYFESACGETELSIVSFSGDESRTEFSVDLYVVPSKIGWNNYKAMVADLQGVCRALVVDVCGKSRAAAGRSEDDVFKPWRTLEEELVSVCSVCRKLAPLVAEVRASPKMAARFCYRIESVGRCRSPRSLAAMARKGVDPRSGGDSRKLPSGRITPTFDIAEHRLLKAFMKLLASRVRGCLAGISEEIRRLEAEKKYRSRSPLNGEPSLYESEDVPRIKRLKERAAGAASALAWLCEELGNEFWCGVGESVFAPDAAQFAENDYYLAAANVVLRYLRDVTHWGGVFRSGFMAKKSSRMYEQWVFVQLVASFRAAGLPLVEWETALRRAANGRFGFDFPRNTTLRAPIAEGYDVVLRYEPWIHPKSEMWKNPGESLCHFGDSSWSPDYVVELVRTRGQLKTVYAIAMDAKYSRKPTREMRDSVFKYAKIRSSVGTFGRRVARQVWLVYPGGEGRKKKFVLDDEAMCFSPEAGPVYKDSKVAVEILEQVFADLASMPGGRVDADVEMGDVGVKPRPEFLEFASGTLAYLAGVVREDVETASCGSHSSGNWRGQGDESRLVF